MILRLIVLLFTLVSLCGFCLAAGLQNITIDSDDSNSAQWASFTPEQAWSKVDSNGIWRESTVNSSSQGAAPVATFTFNGSAIYVYCNFEAYQASNMSIVMDGMFINKGFISFSEPGTHLVFNQTGLTSGVQHLLVVQNNGDNQKPSNLSLSKVVITIGDDTDTSHPQVGVIVGGVLGGLSLIPLCGLGYLLYLRRRQRPDTEAVAESQPRANNDIQQQQQQQATSRWRSPTLLSNISRLNPVTLVQRTLATNTVQTQRAARTFQIDDSSRGGVRDGPDTNHMSSVPSSPWFVDPSQRLNRVQRWQQQTHEATRDVEMAPPDMSEELSSYYDDNATDSQRYRPGTPPPPPRRFVIRNK
ncbi:hypothetical protein K435DRAFT_288441 [Dendrothele bispora CBS 962.96]|uniref:Mid2 domain-containing protein n=1 Tax=Dendrothele bispora (strain CBS 962.96) TaxID=1314807 RepID=A0A4S8LK93_DENBC|nr:hypothetical protein K435DRAFT_288441 [Dendrothele bispora CBS 962.96]